MLIRIGAHTPALRRGSVAGGSGYVAVMDANFRPDAWSFPLGVGFRTDLFAGEARVLQFSVGGLLNV